MIAETYSTVGRSLPRVLTTSARKPPLRTDKFAALWRIAAPVHPIRRSNCAEFWLLRTHSSPKRSHEQQLKRVTGPKRRGENGKSAISASKRADLNGGFRADVVSTRYRFAVCESADQGER